MPKKNFKTKRPEVATLCNTKAPRERTHKLGSYAEPFARGLANLGKVRPAEEQVLVCQKLAEWHLLIREQASLVV